MHEPLPGGPSKGQHVDPTDLRNAVSLYYEVNGWDDKASPTQGKLIELGLEWLFRSPPSEHGCDPENLT